MNNLIKNILVLFACYFLFMINPLLAVERIYIYFCVEALEG